MCGFGVRVLSGASAGPLIERGRAADRSGAVLTVRQTRWFLAAFVIYLAVFVGSNRLVESIRIEEELR